MNLWKWLFSRNKKDHVITNSSTIETPEPVAKKSPKCDRQAALEALAAKALQLEEQANTLAKHNYLRIDGKLVEMSDRNGGENAKCYIHKMTSYKHGDGNVGVEIIESVSLHVFSRSASRMLSFGESFSPYKVNTDDIMSMVIEAPPEWVSVLNELYGTNYAIEKDLMYLKGVQGALVRGKSITLMQLGKEQKLTPIIKFYEDQQWITHGWEGPAIVIVDLDKSTVSGVVPSSVTQYTYDEHVLPRYRELRENAVFQSIPDVVKCKGHYLSLLKDLEDLVNEIQFNKGHVHDPSE